MIADFMFQQLCASPALEPYKGTLYGNGFPISNAKVTLLSYSNKYQVVGILAMMPLRGLLGETSVSMSSSLKAPYLL